MKLFAQEKEEEYVSLSLSPLESFYSRIETCMFTSQLHEIECAVQCFLLLIFVLRFWFVLFFAEFNSKLYNVIVATSS